MLPTVHRAKTQTNSPKAAGPAFTGITAFDTDTFNIRRPNSASTRVVLLTELLEEILLYLPINDLMALRGASPLFHHCISHSPRLQTKLFLRPSKAPLTFYNWSWSRLDSNGLPVGDLHLQETKLLPRANTKTPYWESLCEPSPVQPARTCPLIHSWGIPKDQWPTELTDTDLPVTCVGIIATPEELARFGTMLFTDPPVYEVHAKLHYRHNRDANLYITGERHVKSEFPLTVHGFLDAAFRMPGDTCVHDVDFRDVETVVLRTWLEGFIATMALRGRAGAWNITSITAVPSDQKFTKQNCKRAPSKKKMWYHIYPIYRSTGNRLFKTGSLEPGAGTVLCNQSFIPDLRTEPKRRGTIQYYEHTPALS